MNSIEDHPCLKPFEGIALTDVGRLDEYVELPDKVLLHAGPPYNGLNDVPTPVMNAACQVLMIDGVADSIDQAKALIKHKTYKLKPAQLYGVVTPLSQVVSKNSWVFQVKDQETGIQANAPLIESASPALRFGSDTAATRASVRTLDSLTPGLQSQLCTLQIPIAPLIAAGLSQGDECHAITAATHKALVQRLSCTQAAINENPGFVLPLIMAASSVALRRAGTITAVGGNGLDIGWIPAGKSYWHQMRASIPAGELFDEKFGAQVLPAIGDSAVIDFAGLGAQAREWFPQMKSLWQQHLPNFELPDRSSVIDPQTGMVDLNSIVTNNAGPAIHLAMVDKTGSGKILGRGVVVLDADLFNMCANSEAWGMITWP